ncbi:MAG: FAD-dependent oxidoreductase [Bacillati bacterium ANGP1]|uniref:FAD-dependent oxidoreductase n=1 Tax=Candidatus Segetimicrobium genomatis TaxID=2569760 RepID=A0A537JJ11_9BACT|nr:MAG: FAD-dependent oxidoreductase [Terrabacteria group bacterium ANGP1]
MSTATGPAIVETRCCIVGGGPAGMMLGYLLARSGVDVVILERHADFFRDFRGDTIHPSTLELMHELGILEDLLRQPHQEQQRFEFRIGRDRVLGPDFSRLPTRCKFMVFMPQWDFLNFLAGKAKRYRGFHLVMQADVTDLARDGERITGAVAATPGGEIAVRAALVVGTDGRHSTVREKAGLESVALGSPIDVLWMRISRRPDDPEQILGTFDAGKGLVMLNRGDYWQCGYIIPKGTLDGLKQRGIAALRNDILALVPWLHGRVNELEGWDDIKLLTVMVDRLVEWYRPGVLCIGDAAHAMSPIGGVGINLAIQDAVAAANILAPALRGSRTSVEPLRSVQRRRELPTRLTQALQVLIQDRVINPMLTGGAMRTMTMVIWMLRRLGFLRHLLARALGVGFRPEHVRTPDVLVEDAPSGERR